MSQASPDRMTPEAIVEEISKLQGELSTKFARIHVLSQGLYHRVRRAPVDDNTILYMRYASTWMRFSGAADQGIKRSAHVSKALSRLTPVEPVVVATAPIPKKESASVSPVEALLNLYSAEAQGEFVPYRDRDRAASKEDESD